MRSATNILNLLIIFILSAAHPILQAEIAHLELGAANYGTHFGSSNNQFRVLEETVNDLIHYYGSEGVIYLNDIDPEGVSMAVSHLRNWLLTKKGLTKIAVVGLPGDYTQIPIPKVTTAHLTNPGTNQLPVRGKPRKTNIEIIRQLEKLAHQSATGLRITSYFKKGLLSPMTLIKIYTSSTIFKQIADSGYEYYLPNGTLWSESYAAKENLQISHTRTYLLRQKRYTCEDILTQISYFWLKAFDSVF